MVYTFGHASTYSFKILENTMQMRHDACLYEAHNLVISQISTQRSKI